MNRKHVLCVCCAKRISCVDIILNIYDDEISEALSFYSVVGFFGFLKHINLVLIHIIPWDCGEYIDVIQRTYKVDKI